jgi:hypothetical protein
MNQGYVKLWRKSKESAIFGHEGLWKLWCLCLMKASHKEHTVLVEATPVTLKPGQFITGRYSLWEDYHQWHLLKRKPRRKPTPSAKTVRRWLLTLQNMQMLSIKKTNKYSIISITNWKQYQQNVQQASNRCPTGVHKQEINKNVKEIYVAYLKHIQPLRKSKKRALNNIERHLKKNSIGSLLEAIKNYATTLKGTQPQFRKDPANFFGINEPYFIDFLPDSFEPATNQDVPKKFEWSPKDDER